MLELNRIHQGDSWRLAEQLADESVDCVCTSPPYWGLRDYGVDGQAGLEEHPQDWVDKMVWLCKLLRPKLKSSGVMFWNIGETYFNGEAQRAGTKHKENVGDGLYNRLEGMNTSQEEVQFKPKGDGVWLQPKQMLGLPWRFAISMQEGSGIIVKRKEDRIWLAAIIDGEGCITIHRRDKERKNATYGAMLMISMTDKCVIDKLYEISGKRGSIVEQTKGRNKKIYRWSVMSTEAKEIIADAYDFLVAKKNQARCVLFAPPSGKEAEMCWINIKMLHKKNISSRDYPEPEMYQDARQGWILRNAICWWKPNHMPSSVKDRMSNSYEYVFMFVKSRKYFFDLDAIREPHEWAEKDKRSALRRVEHKSGKSFEEQPYASTAVGYNPAGKNPGDVWRITTRPHPFAHFAVYPEELAMRCIKAGSPKQGVVLDPFMGSGTTAVVAKRLGRQYIGFELSKEYLKIAERRLAGVIDWQLMKDIDAGKQLVLEDIPK